MLKEYESLADETDINVIKSFKRKYSDIAIFEEDGKVSINAPLRFSPIANKSGVFKIGKSLMISNAEKSIQIVDGDKSKINEALKMDFKQSSQNIMVSLEKSNSLDTRGACKGALNQTMDIYNNQVYIREKQSSSSFKYEADTKLTISNWSFLQPGQDPNFPEHFVSLTANTKSYKRGAFGLWYSTSVLKHCHGRVKVKVASHVGALNPNGTLEFCNPIQFFRVQCQTFQNILIQLFHEIYTVFNRSIYAFVYMGAEKNYY